MDCSDQWKIEELINLFKKNENKEIIKQFKEAEEYRKANLENNQSTAHPQAYYTSRLLNPFTKNLPKYDNIDNISVEVFDFTK